ncbi:MAG: helix-turn-helix domain-containing protein [Pseudomonadota bacterium]
MKRVDYRRAKTHRSYTYEEAARALGVHPHTIKGWRKKGLPVIDDRRPHLIRGQDLRAFVKAAKEADKRPCAPGEMYCLSCRQPSKPAGEMVDIIRSDQGMAANLYAICERCEKPMRQRAGDRTIAEFRRLYTVTERQAERTLREDR